MGKANKQRNPVLENAGRRKGERELWTICTCGFRASDPIKGWKAESRAQVTSKSRFFRQIRVQKLRKCRPRRFFSARFTGFYRASQSDAAVRLLPQKKNNVLGVPPFFSSVCFFVWCFRKVLARAATLSPSPLSSSPLFLRVLLTSLFINGRRQRPRTQIRLRGCPL
jgi:hypothetical protein